MQYSIQRPEIPVIWLDTHAISNFAYALHSPTASGSPGRVALYEKICELRRRGQILCFESDQLTEIEVRPELVERASTVLTQTSQGVSTHYQFPLRMQDQIAMKAACEHTESADIAFRTGFNMRDPLARQTVGGFIVRARIPRSRENIAETKANNRSIASSWESMRLANVSAPGTTAEKVRRHTQLEKLAGQDIFNRVFRRAMEQRISGQQPSTEEFFQQMEFIGQPVTTWQRYGGNNSAQEISDFFGSDYYTGLPYIDIRSHLTAHRIAGNERIKPSDVMDIHNISAFLPYSSIMVLDRSMVAAVNRLGLSEKYGTTVIPLANLSALLPALQD